MWQHVYVGGKMGHNVIKCNNCDSLVMESHNTWECDCRWKYPEPHTGKCKATSIIQQKLKSAASQLDIVDNLLDVIDINLEKHAN